MKTLRKLSLPLQGIGITAVLLLLTQSAFALGTDEDTNINNRASVDYAVGGVGQVVIESAPGAGNSTPGATLGTDTVFEVDRLIDFEVTGPAGNTIIAPGELDAVLVFTMTNSGNDHQDFGFVVTNLAGDDFDMNAGTLQVFVDSNANSIMVSRPRRYLSWQMPTARHRLTVIWLTCSWKRVPTMATTA